MSAPAQTTEAPQGLGARLEPYLARIVAPLAAVLAYRNAAEVEFVGDARMLIADNRRMDGIGFCWDNLTHDYFWSSAGQLVPYWRPVTKGSWCLEHQLFGGFAGGYALVQLGWHVLLVIGVELLGRALGLRRRLAAAAALIVALHPVAIAPVSMIMARSDVVATAAVVGSVLGWWHWRQGGRQRHRWAALHVVALLLALGSKETAAVLPALLAAFSLLEGDRWRHGRRRLALLLPAVVATASYLVLRTWLLGRQAPGLERVSLGFDPLRVVTGLAAYLANLWPFTISSTVRDIPVREAQSASFWWTGAPTLLAAAVVAGFAVRRRDRLLLWSWCWIAAALSPVLLTAEIHLPAVEGKYPLADRWLYHALPAGALGLVRLVEALRPRWLTRAFQLATAAWAAWMLVDSAPARAEFATELGMLDNEDRAYYYATPERFRTDQDRCRFHERRVERARRRGDDAAVVRAFEGYRQHCRRVPAARQMQLLEALWRLERYEAARTVAEQLLQAPPAGRPARRRLARLYGTMLAQRGATARAEQWLLRARELGDGDCRLLVTLAELARAQQRAPTAVDRLIAAFACGGEQDPSLLLAAATWALQEGMERRARALIDRTAGRPALSADQRAQLRYLEHRLDGAGGAAPAPGVPVLQRP